MLETKAMRGPITWHQATPSQRAGAIGLLVLQGDIEGALARLGIAPVPVGEMRLRDLAGVDRGVVARVKLDTAFLMPHGGLEILRQLAQVLEREGITHQGEASATSRYPEARSPFEARLLDALAKAASPRAVELLLDQPRRWSDSGEPSPNPSVPAPDEQQSLQLDRLLTPPLIVAVGASNIGKSTLLNRLCGRIVAATADEPGTTKDHVGSLLEVDGLVVRFVDSPGFRADAPAAEQEARAIAEALLPGADLIVQLGDAGSPPPSTRSAQRRDSPSEPGRERGASLRVALRADLGRSAWEHDVAVSAKTGQGMEELAVRMRRALVSDEALASPVPWRFWSA